MNSTDLQQIASLLDRKLEPIQKQLQKHEKLLKSLKRDHDTMLNMLDQKQMDQRKRLEAIEQHVSISSTSL